MSIWIEEKNITNKNNTKNQVFSTLNQDLKATVCVIGAGLTGITTCYYLNQHNIDFCLIDKGKIMSRTSGNTTAKITYMHDLFYRYLIDSYGIEFAKGYYLSQNEALENIKKIIETEKIDCDFKIQDHYIYTIKQDMVSKLKDEHTAYHMLGVNCEYKNHIPLPLQDIVASIQVKNQASFHPIKYAQGLIQTFSNQPIYENTAVTDITKSGDSYLIHTDQNKQISCKYVVMATKYPIKDFPGFHFLKMYQETSYLIAIQTNKQIFDDMFLSCDSPNLSFRKAMYHGKEILLIGGNSHKTGENISLLNRYQLLTDTAKKLFPDYKLIDKWNTQDCISLDKVPYIGNFSNLLPNIYLATGFKKWGMTSSHVAAKLMSDKIIGLKNNFESIYNATRFKPLKNAKELGNMVKEVANSMVINKFKINEESLEDIEKNTGKIIKINGELVGVYKDEKSKIHAVVPTCTHLGCLLKFNDLDKTWDCPCHGSRFDYQGNNLYNPAYKKLKQIKLNQS